jgi:uncharacterized repeat protein (TIGR03803 family)
MRFSVKFLPVLLILAMVAAALVAPPAHAQKLTVIYRFAGMPDGNYPQAPLIRDAEGNFYGTTTFGGDGAMCFVEYDLGCGSVFKVDAKGRVTVLYSFCNEAYCADGADPTGGLVRDADGNLYGTTSWGGVTSTCDVDLGFGCGTVFKIDASGKETVLYSFTGKPDGESPEAGLVRDGQGNLYGTTNRGGMGNHGIAFKLTPDGHETVLHRFGGGTDGVHPEAGLIRDADGNLYGTTQGGGAYGYGTVFELDPSGHETILHSFAGTDGENVVSGLLRDADGNLYGTTLQGGNSSGGGTLFKLDPSGNETVLYNFCTLHLCTDGAFPRGNLIQDAKGNFYATTQSGGNQVLACEYGCGVAYELQTTGEEIVLHSFCTGVSCPDGDFPNSGLIGDGHGNVYGTAALGGDSECNGPAPHYGCGTVFKITP